MTGRRSGEAAQSARAMPADETLRAERRGMVNTGNRLDRAHGQCRRTRGCGRSRQAWATAASATAAGGRTKRRGRRTNGRGRVATSRARARSGLRRRCARTCAGARPRPGRAKAVGSPGKRSRSGAILGDREWPGGPCPGPERIPSAPSRPAGLGKEVASGRPRLASPRRRAKAAGAGAPSCPAASRREGIWPTAPGQPPASDAGARHPRHLPRGLRDAPGRARLSMTREDVRFS